MADNDQLLGRTVVVNPAAGDQTGDQTPDYLDILVGDGKKYADNGNLAKGYANLQAHNQTILDEKVQLEAALKLAQSGAKSVEDILAAIKGSGASTKVDDLNLGGENTGAQALSKEDIVSLIAGTLDQRDEKSAANAKVTEIEANQTVTWEKLSKVYGDMAKADAAVAMYVGNDAKKRELVQNLGSFDPETLLTIMQAAVPPQGEKVEFGMGDIGKKSVDEKLPTPQGLFTYAEAEVVRKKDKRLYNSREFQLRLHKSAAEHPRFWDGTARRKK